MKMERLLKETAELAAVAKVNVSPDSSRIQT